MRETEIGDSGQHEGKKGKAERKTRCNMREEMCFVCVCVCVMTEEKKPKRGTRGKSKHEEKKNNFC